MTDYKLTNIKKRELKLSKQRGDILKLEPEAALDEILSSSKPATLIQSFPDQDLYFLMHSIGSEDFIPVLSLSSSEQWEYILDMDIWTDDTPDMIHMTNSLSLLFRADPQRLMRWIVKEKVDLLEYYFLNHMEIKIREHDDVPPDEEGFITFDDKFYFRFPGALEDDDDKKEKNAQELIISMLEAVAKMDLSVFHALLFETASVLGPEVEEEQFRLKNVRLAEKGFFPAHEAVGIYQPLSSEKLRKRPRNKKGSYNPDTPVVSNYASQFVKDDNLFAVSLKTVNDEFFLLLQLEFASLVNKVISADRIKIREKDDINKVIEKVCGYLSVGIEKIDKKNSVLVIENYILEDIFRIGSREILRLGRKIKVWYKTSFLNKNKLPLSFLDEKWLGIVGGLMLDRPLLFDDFSSKELYRNFKSLLEVNQTALEIEKIVETDRVLGLIDVDVQSFSKGILTYKSLLFTLWAKNRLNLGDSLDPIRQDVFKEFFIALFANKKDFKIETIKRDDFLLWISKVSKNEEDEISGIFVKVASEMLDEIEEEYGVVGADNLDHRMIRHFLLE